MIYNGELRRQYKQRARESIRKAFWPTIGAVVLEMIPIALIAMIYSIGLDMGKMGYSAGINISKAGYSVVVNDVANSAGMADLGRVYGSLFLYLVAMLFIGVPIQFGAKHYFVARARGQEASPALVFSCFASGKKYVTSIKIALCVFVRSLGWLVLLWAGTAALTGILVVSFLPALDSADIGGMTIVLCLVCIAALAVLSVWISVKIRRYDGVYICMIDTPDASVWEATGSCAPIFKHHNWELFVFDLSFFLWELLIIVTLGIAALYVSAYVEIAFVNYFDGLCGADAQPQTPELAQ